LVCSDVLDSDNVVIEELCVVVEAGVEVEPSSSLAIAVAQQPAESQGPDWRVGRVGYSRNDKWVCGPTGDI
jgi:hypothetical protein